MRGSPKPSRGSASTRIPLRRSASARPSSTPLLFSAALCAAVWAEVFLLRGGLLRLPLPIGGGYGFPLPLISWLSLAAYAAAARRLDPASSGGRWRQVLLAGFAVHLMALLASLPRDFATIRVELSVWYPRYWTVVWVAGLSGAVGWVAVQGARWKGREWIVMPVAMSTVLWEIVSAAWLPSVAMAALLIGAAAAWLRRAAWVIRMREAAGRIVRQDRWFLVAVFLTALGVRLFYTTRVMSNPDFLNTGSDGPMYDALARALLRGGADPRWTPIPMLVPGYIRFLAFLYATVSHATIRDSYFLVCAVQSVFGALACLLLYDVGRRLGGAAVGRLAAVFGALNFLMTFAAAGIGHQAMDLFWTLFVVWCLVCYLEAPRWLGRWMPLIGVMAGWAALTREGNYLLWPLVCLWLVLGQRRRLGWRIALLDAAGFTVGFFAVVLPLMSSEGSVHGRLSQQWFFYQNAGIDINGWFNPWRDPEIAWALLRSRPLEVLGKVTWAVIGNFNVIFLNQGFGFFDLTFMLRWSTYYFGLWAYAYVAAFAGLALVLWRGIRAPREWLGWWLIVGVLAARVSVHLLFEAGYRHRPPFEPYVILLAALAVVRLFARKGPRFFH